MESRQVTFQILFTSDLHGAFRTYNYATCQDAPDGFPRIATLMKEDRKNFPGRTIICDCGDSIQGNGTGELVKSKKFQPYPLFAAFDEVGYDFVALGNHEFNFGLESMYEMFEGYKGAKLCGNVFDEQGNYLKEFEPYHIVTIAEGGPRVAFIGMVSPNISIWDKANIDNARIRSTDAAKETQRIIAQLKKENKADIFIALQHMDEASELNAPGSGAAEVVKENPELSLFLGAHFHKIKGDKENQLVLDSCKFMENLAGAASYGRILITCTLEEGRWKVKNRTGTYEESDVKTDIICPGPDTREDASVNAVTEDAHKFLSDFMQTTVLGWLPNAPLLPEPAIKGTHKGLLGSNPLIHLVTKVMLHYSHADIAAAALNSFTANCQNVKITAGSVSQIYVYDNNTLYLVKMTGEQLLKWMEWSYAFFGTSLEPGKPAVNPDTDLTIPYGARKVYLFDQFSGINYTVDLTQPTGKRIRILGMGDGTPFNPDSSYRIATTNYRATTNLLMNSDDGIFKPGEKVAELIESDVKSYSGEINMLDMITEYIKEQKDNTIYSTNENNWKFIDPGWRQEWRDLAIRFINDGTISDYDPSKPVTISQVQECIKQK